MKILKLKILIMGLTFAEDMRDTPWMVDESKNSLSACIFTNKMFYLMSVAYFTSVKPKLLNPALFDGKRVSHKNLYNIS